MNELLLQNYATLIIKTGVNLQPGQTLVITAPLDSSSFVHILSKAAYKAGARDVVVQWHDDTLSKIRYENAPQEVFAEYPAWQKDFFMSYAQKGAAFVRLSSSDPDLLQDVDPKPIAIAQKAARLALSDYQERVMSNQNAWCVAATPSLAWAKKVFPHITTDDAVNKLWDAIISCVRADKDDPVLAWETHKEALHKRCEQLNSFKLAKLHIRNSLGTEVTVELSPEHLWLGGGSQTQDDREFVPNLPTEEIFTLPKKYGINGKVVSTMPLNYNGQLIEDFTLTIINGKVIEYTAKRGYEVLKNLLEADEGSSYFGEIALVPFNSPIASTNVLFYNTLFDENASCHFALGKAYPICLHGHEKMSKEDYAKHEVNDSLIHVDFMIGSADLEIIGETVSGEHIKIFTEGNFGF